MAQFKTFALAFVVGGTYALIGQIILALWKIALGPDFAYLVPLTLLSLALVAFILYLTGIHQRIAAVSGYGSILPFNGFACAVADCFENTASDTGSNAQGVLAALKMVLYIIGMGSLFCILIGIVAFFIA